MSDTWGYDNSNGNSGLDNSNELNGPKALREAYEAMKAQNKELQEGLAAIQTELRSQKVSAVFDSLGIPQAAKVYQGDPDPEKAREWAESMRSVFGNGNQGATPQNVEGNPPAMEPGVQEQLQRMNESGQAGTPLGNMDAAAAAVGDASDINSLIAAMQRARQMG